MHALTLLLTISFSGNCDDRMVGSDFAWNT